MIAMHAEQHEVAAPLPSDRNQAVIAELWAQGDWDSAEIAQTLALSESAVCRVLADQQDARCFARKMGRSA
ncbi:hypothetical protein MBTS_10955 [Methylobacterium bullatum]|nr:hypothetical protein [Methylobacterium bullatum]